MTEPINLVQYRLDKERLLQGREPAREAMPQETRSNVVYARVGDTILCAARDGVQLDRDDFEGGDRPWLVAVFTSATCESCARATAKAAILASPNVAYQEIPYQGRKDLHDRYHVKAVPCIVVADDEGVVRASFIGVPTATDLWAAVAEARHPGSSPEPDLGHPFPPPAEL